MKPVTIVLVSAILCACVFVKSWRGDKLRTRSGTQRYLLTEGPLHTVVAEGTWPCFPGTVGRSPLGWAQAGHPGGLEPGTSSGLGEKVCGSDSPVGTTPVGLPWAVQPIGSLSGQHHEVSVPTAGERSAECLHSAPSYSQDVPRQPLFHCSGLSFLKCLRGIQVCEAFLVIL